jgi:hypothetical protein
VDLLALHYKVLAEQPDADRNELRAYLERAIADSPDNRLLYSFLVRYHGAEDMAAAYDAIRAWMLLDSRRRELAVQRRVFAP